MSKRRQYSAELKHEAVQTVTMPDETQRRVAMDLGTGEGIRGRNMSRKVLNRSLELAK